ncbi:hypothetical protein F5X68DRAFT_53417 [Plectosphaerella plurivora]|uniref:Uncharacterized protein n=1 Tax=Plectosphaerella plurivora TaxID=936078 RepID=A0A9P8V2Q3_9PEZI|nr:hypothetical protein F5X68DRAFT_53417 [Plectosphaerella plurivora]
MDTASMWMPRCEMDPMDLAPRIMGVSGPAFAGAQLKGISGERRFKVGSFALLALRAHREAPDLGSRARSHTQTPAPKAAGGGWRKAKGTKSGYDAAGGLIPHRRSSNGEERQTGGTLGDPGIGLLRLRPRWPAMPQRRTTRLAHYQRIVLQRHEQHSTSDSFMRFCESARHFPRAASGIVQLSSLIHRPRRRHGRSTRRFPRSTATHSGWLDGSNGFRLA